jgi:serine/threonine protein kinase
VRIGLGCLPSLKYNVPRRVLKGFIPYWAAPEHFHLAELTEKSDVWSLGMIARTLIEGDPPYIDDGLMTTYFMLTFPNKSRLRIKSKTHLLQKQMKYKLIPNETLLKCDERIQKSCEEPALPYSQTEWSVALTEFLEVCLKENTNERLSPKELLTNPFLNEFVCDRYMVKELVSLVMEKYFVCFSFIFLSFFLSLFFLHFSCKLLFPPTL